MKMNWIGKSTDGSTVTLKKLKDLPIETAPYASESWLKQNQDLVRRALVLDVETTGLNSQEDQIIELAIRPFLFNKDNGDVLRIETAYTSFQDPGRPLKPEIVQLTGITDDMLAGKKIDWEQVDEIFASAQLIIAHNARFDRPFIEKKSKVSPEKVWGCSLKQVDWASKGFMSPKLELLNIYHGFFIDSHRALNDVDALFYLMTLPPELTGAPTTYLTEVIKNARRSTTQVIATGSPFETKDLLKSRGYSWDNTNKFWHRTAYRDELPAEIQWLEENVYNGPFAGFTRDIALTESFKA